MKKNRSRLREEKPKGHCFTTEVIKLTLLLRQSTSASFRDISESLKLISQRIYPNEKRRTPSYSTIYRYSKKLGYYCHKTISNLSPGKWVIIIDEKLLEIREKLVLILGIREEDIPLKRALRIDDLQVLSADVSEKTDHKMICLKLEEAERKLSGGQSISYAISDDGLNLRRAIKDKGFEHLRDFRHLIANVFKRIYLKDESYKEVTEMMVLLRKKLQQTSLAELTPPALKTKCRFHNIGIIVHWYRKADEYLRNNPENIKAQESFEWIRVYSNFFEELDRTLVAAESIINILSTRGLDLNTMEQSVEILSDLQTTSSSRIFKAMIIEYFDQTKELLKGRNRLLCFSDVIESIFGKHNKFQSANKNLHATGWTVLSLAFMTAKIEQLDIKSIFEQVRLKHIDQWTKQNNLNRNKWKQRLKNNQSQLNQIPDGKILEPLPI